MNRFTKFLICLVSLVGIIQSGWLLGIVIPIDHVSRVLLPSVQTQTTWIWVLGIVISLIVTLVGIVGIAIAYLPHERLIDCGLIHQMAN